jgi:hypothetical protein
MGGLIEHETYLSRRLTKHIRQAVSEIRIQESSFPPIAGAVMEAFKMQHDHIPTEFLSRLKASLQMPRDA